ncbi:MAG: phosphoribosylformylglycinamidine cyclo-ligase [Candidatus Ancillula sp.]|jgi:phosphoribosylformylglycinamidine cyclo-ligase|nr:phosphoribosylformylglycinamidine cyclo-ligase [Candidatus Ancillula sp.]
MTGITYKDAGVDIQAGDLAVELMKSSVKSTLNSNVVKGAGGFAGMFSIKQFQDMHDPILTTSTDGVGTKVEIARKIDKHDSIGHDLVGMVVDDISVTGATPLFMTDYICCGKLVPTKIAEIVKGIAEGCRLAQTALVGGETAEHPGLLADDEYDVAGAATGIVDREKLLDPENICKSETTEQGDVIIGLASSGLHSNGFSLVRKVFQNAGWGYDKVLHEFAGEENGVLGRFSSAPTLGEVLLTPTRIYSKLCLELAEKFDVKIFSHVTGGGIASNLARVLPGGAFAVLDPRHWEVREPQIFKLIQELGNVPEDDMRRTLNLGVGMIAIVAETDQDALIEYCAGQGVDAFFMGLVGRRPGEFAFDFAKDKPESEFVHGTKGVDGGKVFLGQF